MFNQCCVVNCNSRRKNVSLFSFPKNEKRLEMWLKCLNSEALRCLNVDQIHKHYVCRKHFEKRFISATTVRPRLRIGAYPTLFSENEIRNGIPETAIVDHIRPEVFEHNYAKKRQHQDHTYYATTEKRQKSHSETHSITSSSISTKNIEDIISYELPSTSTVDGATETVMEGEVIAPNNEVLVQKTRFLYKKKCFSRNNKLYKEYRRSRKQVTYLKRARRALQYSRDMMFEKITLKMNPLAKKIMWMQLKHITKKSKGRRFTNEEKLIALSILKQSPKCYKFLQKIFILPSKNTLNKMINALNIESGINPQVFDAVKKEVKTWKKNKKFCSILFDEVALEPGLSYDKMKDSILGFVELNKKTNDFADHGLVFMLRGAIYNWQQPLAYYYCKGATSSTELKIIIKEVVTAVSNTGLLPIAIVSDQGSAFQAALKSLQQDTRRLQIIAGEKIDDVIDINGHSLSVIHDPPHLIKGIRNNFLTKNLKYEKKVCKWGDIVEIYKTDCNHAHIRLLHKLNDEHIIPEKIKKMKVKNCVRVFSKTVAATLLYTAQFSHYGDGAEVSSTLENTAAVVSFLDDLFDSVNGANTKGKDGKKLRTAVSATSSHHNFWNDALIKLEEMRFIDHTGKESSVPSLKNFITTLKSFQRLWQFFKKNNIKIMRPRYFNSDPIENFFGQVRAYNYRNVNPNCHTFKNTFKSLLITRFIKFHSENYNCEEDSGEQLIKIKSLFETATTNTANSCSTASSDVQSGIIESISSTASQERLIVHSRAYATGWVIRKIFNKHKCSHCEQILTSCKESSVNKWISFREYKSIKKQKLTYPSEHAVRYFGSIMQEVNEYLETRAQNEHVIKELKKIIKSKYSFDFFNCNLHRDVVLECFLNLSLRLAVFNWCNIINKILKGTDIFRLENKVLPPLQYKALEKYKRKLKNKNNNK